MWNFPGASIVRQGGCVFLKADSHGTPKLLNAILEVFPLDIYTDSPAMLMQKMDCDKELGIPIWDKYTESVARHDPRCAEAVGFHARFRLYDEARTCYCALQSGETSIYAIKKGVVKQYA